MLHQEGIAHSIYLYVCFWEFDGEFSISAKITNLFLADNNKCLVTTNLINEQTTSGVISGEVL
jgi:hypothetical protein